MSDDFSVFAKKLWFLSSVHMLCDSIDTLYNSTYILYNLIVNNNVWEAEINRYIVLNLTTVEFILLYIESFVQQRPNC